VGEPPLWPAINCTWVALEEELPGSGGTNPADTSKLVLPPPRPPPKTPSALLALPPPRRQRCAPCLAPSPRPCCRGGGWGPLRRAPIQYLETAGRPGLLRTVLEAQETRGLTRSDDISRLLPSEVRAGWLAGWRGGEGKGGFHGEGVRSNMHVLMY
jgi:hypothetical protein